MRVAVLGHSVLHVAPAVSVDLALRGHAVSWWPAPPAVRAAGGITLQRGERFDAGRDGFAPVATPDSPDTALAHADAVVLDVPPPELLPFVAARIATMRPGLAVHVQSHGYWPAARLAAHFPQAGVHWSDSSAPTHAGALDGAIFEAHTRRRNLRFACAGDSLDTIGALFPGASAAANPLETGLESINLMVHPGATIANLAALERAADARAGFAFYGEGNTASAARLAERLDEERGRVCASWGVRHRSLTETLGALYGARGTNVREAIADCPFYRALGALPAGAPCEWARIDLPYALVPLVRLATAQGIEVPMHRAAISVLATAFGLDPWLGAPQLQDLGVS